MDAKIYTATLQQLGTVEKVAAKLLERSPDRMSTDTKNGNASHDQVLCKVKCTIKSVYAHSSLSHTLTHVICS